VAAKSPAGSQRAEVLERYGIPEMPVFVIVFFAGEKPRFAENGN
jgi:hypothetical protein